MAIKKDLRFKSGQKAPFAQISNWMLQEDDRISFKAKGILCYLLSRGDEWDVYESDIVTHSKDGRDSVKGGLKELMDAGYILREKFRNEKGHFAYQYTVYQFPQINHDGFSVPGSTVPGKPVTINKELSNKDYINKEKDIKRYIQLELDVDNQYIQLYLSHYKIQFKRDHPKVSEEQYEEIVRCINIVKEELDNIKEYARGVVDHFDSLPKRNNGNILAFIKTFMRRYDIQTKEEWT